MRNKSLILIVATCVITSNVFANSWSMHCESKNDEVASFTENSFGMGPLLSFASSDVYISMFSKIEIIRSPTNAGEIAVVGTEINLDHSKIVSFRVPEWKTPEDPSVYHRYFFTDVTLKINDRSGTHSQSFAMECVAKSAE